MKLALLVPAPFDTVSGGYLYDRRIVEGLRAQGHEVQVVELGGRHPLADAAARGAATAALAALPQDVRPIVDGLCLPAFAEAAGALASRGAIGLIHHPVSLETGLEPAARDRLASEERALLPRLARLIATSKATAETLAHAFGCDAARIGVVEPGTDPAPRAKGSGGPAIAILAVGTLVPRKGHDVLLRALGRLTDLDWTLTIAGDGTRDAAHADGLAALAEELGIAQRVTFAGDVDAVALEALYQGADVFALATHYEGYGMAVAEALAHGLPLAITAGGAVRELMPLEAGVMSPPGDANSLSKALRRVLFDAEIRQGMAESAWAAGQLLPRWDDRAAAFAQEIARADG